MSKALYLDLRVSVLAALADGANHRAVALRFGVSAVSVSRWRRRAAAQGNPGPKALGGDRRSGRIGQHREQLLGVLGRPARPDDRGTAPVVGRAGPASSTGP